MFTDEQKRNVWDRIRQHGIRAFAGKLTPSLLTEAAQKTGSKLGRGPLWLGNLVWLGIASAIHRALDFATVLKLTWQLLQDAEGFAQSDLAKKARPRANRQKGKGKPKRKRKRSKHDPRSGAVAGLSEEAWVQARQRMPMGYWLALLMLLADRFVQEQSRWIHWKGFRLLAMDGTTIDLPDWLALRQHYGSAKNGLGAATVQARMVMLQLPLARLPYRYEVVPLKVGECTVAERLVSCLCADDLLLLDRGFWSYGLFWQIAQRRAFFAIRLPKKPKLRTLRRLGPGDRLVTWAPSATVLRKCRKKGQDVPDALCLRVVDYHLKGFRPSAIVTNMLDPKRIPREDWVRLTTETEAGDQRLGVGLYHRRWEIETSFRELKVTQGLEGSLRSRTPPGIEYEIAGHVILYLLVRWLMVEAAAKHGQDPLRLSFSAALRLLVDMGVQLITSSESHVRRVLLPRLLERIARAVVTQRPGRQYPRKGCKNKYQLKRKGRKQHRAKRAA